MKAMELLIMCHMTDYDINSFPFTIIHSTVCMKIMHKNIYTVIMRRFIYIKINTHIHRIINIGHGYSFDEQLLSMVFR